MSQRLFILVEPASEQQKMKHAKVRQLRKFNESPMLRTHLLKSIGSRTTVVVRRAVCELAVDHACFLTGGGSHCTPAFQSPGPKYRDKNRMR
jgi:hypothetical protein